MLADKFISANALTEDLLNKSFYPAIVKRAIEEAPAVEPAFGWIPVTESINCALQSTSGIEDAIEKLAQYEDMEEQGKLVLYPTNAYCIVGNEIRKGFVFEVTYCVCRKPLYTVRYDDYSLDKHTGYLGLSVFLTREEAEEALKELQS